MIDYLERNGISYRFLHRDQFVQFNIFSTDKYFDRVRKELKEMGIRYEPFVYIEYTKADCDNAELLMVTACKQTIDIVNPKSEWRYGCVVESVLGRPVYVHWERTAPVKIRREPTLTTRTAFWYKSTGFADLFTDIRVRKLVEENWLTGMNFEDVYLRNGKKSENIFLVQSDNLIIGSDIALSDAKSCFECPGCGKMQYHFGGEQQLRIDLTKIPKGDFYMTESIFGEGEPEPFRFVSQRFYRLLKQNKLAGNLIFEPVAHWQRP